MPNQDESAPDGNALPPSAEGQLFHSRRWRHVDMFALCLAAAAAITWVASGFTVPADRDTAISTAADGHGFNFSDSSGNPSPHGESSTSSLPGTAKNYSRRPSGWPANCAARFPQLPEALHVAAMTHAQFHQTAEAEKLWRQCLELSPAHPQFSVNLATVVMERGDSEEAAAVLRKAVAAGNPTPDVLYNLGVALTDLGRCEEAEGVVQQALTANPQLAAHWVVLGQAQLKLGKVADAESSLKKALELGAQSPALYFALSNACTRQGKQDEAARHRARFTEMWPRSR